ncbi:MAG: polyphosphate kinase 2 [Hyphomicrobiales bacterium]|nr:polyphosphate kinase 2 [Hyphomicrobiales bacterium]
MPAVITPERDAAQIVTEHGAFDLDDPVLPEWIETGALRAGDYPYDKVLKKKTYEDELERLQIELVKLQRYISVTNQRMVIVFEGRDAAGKGGAIFAFRQYLNPRSVRIVALPKPTEIEQGQWYFQRYSSHLPTRGEIVLFDRSWYNRAGVEPVMGFCTKAEHRVFLDTVHDFEQMLIDEGTVLLKFWLNIGQATQLERFFERRHNPLKIWKLSPIDYTAMHKWNDYTRARDEMLDASHKPATPWAIVRANDKRRARLNIIRFVLSRQDYAGKDESVAREPDPLILGGPELLPD